MYGTFDGTVCGHRPCIFTYVKLFIAQVSVDTFEIGTSGLLLVGVLDGIEDPSDLEFSVDVGIAFGVGTMVGLESSVVDYIVALKLVVVGTEV